VIRAPWNFFQKFPVVSSSKNDVWKISKFIIRVHALHKEASWTNNDKTGRYFWEEYLKILPKFSVHISLQKRHYSKREKSYYVFSKSWKWFYNASRFSNWKVFHLPTHIWRNQWPNLRMLRSEGSEKVSVRNGVLMLSRNGGCTGKKFCSFVTGNTSMRWNPDDANFTISKITDEDDDGRNFLLEQASCNMLYVRCRISDKWNIISRVRTHSLEMSEG